jgi:hypothetical protein
LSSKLEFGGVSAFAFGPLNGIGRLTTGIFVRKIGPSTTIDGFFFAGGAARIACFGVAASLVVRVNMQPGGSMAGQATFTFSFSLGLANLDFSVPVWKAQPALGSKSAGLSLESPTRYAAAGIADSRSPVKGKMPLGGRRPELCRSTDQPAPKGSFQPRASASQRGCPRLSP